MIRARVFLLSFLFLGVLAAEVLAATNTWGGGGPQAGTNAGEIDISGSAVMDAGFTLQGNGIAVAYPTGVAGGVLVPDAGTAVTVNANGTWKVTVHRFPEFTKSETIRKAGKQELTSPSFPAFLHS